MRAVIVVNSENNPENYKIGQEFSAEIIRRGSNCEIIDMNNSNLQEHEKFQAIQTCNPDWIMSLDLAGFECRTGMGSVSLNLIPCRMAHLILQPSDNNTIRFDDRINYSMYFFVAKEEHGKKLLENVSIEHIEVLPLLSEVVLEKRSPEIIPAILQQLWNTTEMAIDFKECQQL